MEGYSLPPVETGTPGSSALRNPPPKSPCVGEERRAGLGQALPTGSPIVGSRSSPVQSDDAVNNNILVGHDAYVSDAVSSLCPTLTSLRGAAMRASLGGANTAPPSPCFYGLVVPLRTHQLLTVYGVGGLLKNHQACRDWRDRYQKCTSMPCGST